MSSSHLVVAVILVVVADERVSLRPTPKNSLGSEASERVYIVCMEWVC